MEKSNNLAEASANCDQPTPTYTKQHVAVDFPVRELALKINLPITTINDEIEKLKLIKEALIQKNRLLKEEEDTLKSDNQTKREHLKKYDHFSEMYLNKQLDCSNKVKQLSNLRKEKLGERFESLVEPGQTLADLKSDENYANATAKLIELKNRDKLLDHEIEIGNNKFRELQAQLEQDLNCFNELMHKQPDLNVEISILKEKVENQNAQLKHFNENNAILQNELSLEINESAQMYDQMYSTYEQIRSMEGVKQSMLEDIQKKQQINDEIKKETSYIDAQINHYKTVVLPELKGESENIEIELLAIQSNDRIERLKENIEKAKEELNNIETENLKLSEQLDNAQNMTLDENIEKELKLAKSLELELQQLIEDEEVSFKSNMDEMTQKYETEKESLILRNNDLLRKIDELNNTAKLEMENMLRCVQVCKDISTTDEIIKLEESKLKNNESINGRKNDDTSPSSNYSVSQDNLPNSSTAPYFEILRTSRPPGLQQFLPEELCSQGSVTSSSTVNSQFSINRRISCRESSLDANTTNEVARQLNLDYDAAQIYEQNRTYQMAQRIADLHQSKDDDSTT